MTLRDIAQSRRFVAVGTELCRRAIASCDEAGFDALTLPGWTRRHLVAHLAANAEALLRLLHWAHTGEPTPMYSSPEQRAADIAAGAAMSGAELTAWFERSSMALDAGFANMSDDAWNAPVVTAQGRMVAAAETTWMRSREVLIHTVDLGTGVGFGDLPYDFLAQLRNEVLTKRADERLVPLAGNLSDIVAYLVGRGRGGVTVADGAAAPELGPWL